MKRMISPNELYPFWEAEADYSPEEEEMRLGFVVELHEMEWSAYDYAMKQFESWQERLDALYEEKKKIWWDGLSKEEQDEFRKAWLLAVHDR